MRPNSAQAPKMKGVFSILTPAPVFVPLVLAPFASWRFDSWLRPSAALRLSLFAVCLILVIGRLSLTLGEETAVGYFRKALETIRRGAFREAEVHVKAGLKLDPNSPVGHDLLGIAY